MPRACPWHGLRGRAGYDRHEGGARRGPATPPAPPGPIVRETSMRNGILIAWLALFAAPGWADEPVHKGKKLSEWIKQLADKDPEERGAAGKAIGLIGAKAKAAVPALIKALKDED